MEEYYRVPFTSGEALMVLATLRAVARLTAPGTNNIETELEPGILPSAIDRFDGEVPEFLAANAQRLAKVIEQAFRAELSRPRSRREGEAGESGESDGEQTAPPFPIGRTRRLLEDALERRAPVEIEYWVRSRSQWTSRRVDISDVRAENGVWKLAGQCGLRGEYRQFLLDHIRSVRVLDEDDETPDPFTEE